ncbi:MAG: hypothetical protein KDK65_05405 [Chlamydiia bacterium]|nr:hypothetical protein [Chlamydiia bacterium]
MPQKQHFSIKPYHKYNSLLVQLILSEYFHCCLAMEQYQQNQHSLDSTLEMLTGSPHTQRKYFPWSTDQGLLDNLHYYLESFRDNKEIIEIVPLIDWVIQMQRLSSDLQKRGGDTAALVLQLNTFASHFNPLLALFTEDENVLFFLLKIRDKSTVYLGQTWLEEQLFPKYPEKWDGVKKFLLQRYAKRHFDHLLPQIQSIINEITAEKKT